MRVTFALSVLILCGFQLPSVAQSSNSSADHSSPIRRGLPGRRLSGGLRCDHCIDSTQPGPAIIMPANHLLLVEESAPTLLFRLPSTQNTQRSTNQEKPTIQLSIVGPDNDVVYAVETTKVNEIAGIVRLDLSMLDEPPVLASGLAYRWHLSVFCDPENRAIGFDANGTILRLEDVDSLATNDDSDSHLLSTLLSEEDSHLALNWYRDLTALDLAKRQIVDQESIEAQAIETEWRSHLAAVGLEILADTPPIEFTFNTEL